MELLYVLLVVFELFSPLYFRILTACFRFIVCYFSEKEILYWTRAYLHVVFLHNRSYNTLNNSRMNSLTVGFDRIPTLGIRQWVRNPDSDWFRFRIHSPGISMLKSQSDCHLFKMLFSCTAIQMTWYPVELGLVHTRSRCESKFSNSLNFANFKSIELFLYAYDSKNTFYQRYTGWKTTPMCL